MNISAVASIVLVWAMVSNARADQPDSDQTGERVAGGLQLQVKPIKDVYAADDEVAFEVTFQNSGDKDVLLSAGEMLGNGAQLWDKVNLRLFNAAGAEIPVSLGWRVPGVAGRIYPLNLPLRAGSSYVLKIRSRDYFVNEGDKIARGKYSMTCTFKGTHHEPSDLPPVWEKDVTSRSVSFEVR
jgi:hypothetical protein